MNDNTELLRYGRILIVLLAIIALNVIGELLYAGRALILPLAVAVFIYYIMNPMIGVFERRGVPEWLSIILTLIITTAFFVSIGTLIKTNVESFINEFPKYESRIDALFAKFMDLANIPHDFFTNNETLWYQDPRLKDYIENFSLTKIVTTILGSLRGIVSDTLLVLLYLIFLLSGRKQLEEKIKAAFKNDLSTRICLILANINEQIQKYIIVKTATSLTTATLTMIVLWFFDVEFVIVWGLLTFLLNFIPTIGSIIAVVLPLGLAIIQFENIITVAWLLLALAIIQISIGNVIDPRFVGSSINLSPVVVLFSLIFWGWLWGVIGMFLSIPIMVIIKIILDNIPALQFLSVLMSDFSKLKST